MTNTPEPEKEPSQTDGLRQVVVTPGKDIGNVQDTTFIQNRKGEFDLGADYEPLNDE